VGDKKKAAKIQTKREAEKGRVREQTDDKKDKRRK